MNQLVTYTSDMAEIPSWEPVPQSTRDAIERNRVLDNKMINDPVGIKIDEFLASEELGGRFESYKPYVPLVKTKFLELFGFTPKVTNGFFQTVEEFKSEHDRLAKTPSDQEAQLFARSSRRHVREWVQDELLAMRRTKNPSPEYDNETDRMMDEIPDKMDSFCGWIYQNITIATPQQK